MPFVLFLLGLIAFAFAGLLHVIKQDPAIVFDLMLIGGVLYGAAGIWVSRGVYPWRRGPAA